MFDLFGGAGMDLLSPELIAQRAIAEGIPPPAMAPMDRINESFGALLQPTAGPAAVPTESFPRPPVVAPGPAGPMASPVGIMPMASAGMADPFSAEGPGKGPANSNMADRLLATLRNVKAPEAPVPQRVGTPAAPRPHGTIQSGQLLALLSALGVGDGAGGLKLPSTLGSALRG